MVTENEYLKAEFEANKDKVLSKEDALGFGTFLGIYYDFKTTVDGEALFYSLLDDELYTISQIFEIYLKQKNNQHSVKI